MRAQFVNEKFTEEGDPVRDMGIGKVPYNYHNLYIAKHDIEYVSATHKVKVPKGTVVSAAGGGYFRDSTGKISPGNIYKVNRKNIPGGYNLREDKDNYIEVYYDVWEKSIKLKVQNWFRDDKNIDAAAKVLDIDGVYKAIEHQRDVIKKMEKLLK